MNENLIPEEPTAFPGYDKLLRAVKDRIRTAQVRAALAVNSELVLLYWQIGRDISRQIREQGWGAKFVDQFAADLRREFPDIKGFSPRNLRYMRSFTEAWTEEPILQQVVAKLPWGHNVRLLDYLNTAEERLWYARQTTEYGWSRNVLVHQIESKLYQRQGKAITNAERALPTPHSDLAHQLLKDPSNLLSKFAVPSSR
jgi:predicted nuclease of restriction endonuclease-like (RecB) superfamily